jgi:large conductance mechanosensitive channel
MATEVATETVRKEWNDFKSFAFKGNAFDLAVGVIVGAAFGRIVDGIVNLLIMPLSGNVTSTVLGEAQKQGAVLAYGAFITVVINFLLVAFVLFQLVKISNRMKKAEPAPPPAGPTKSEELLAEIRDALRSKPSA